MERDILTEEEKVNSEIVSPEVNGFYTTMSNIESD